MSRELSRNQRRLAAIAAFGVFWGAFLVTIGFRLLHVVIVLVVLVGAAAFALGGRHTIGILRRHVSGATSAAAGRFRAAGTAALGFFRAASSRVARIDWQGLRHTARRRAEPAARAGRQAAATAGELAAAGSRRVAAAGGAAVTAVESQARTVRRDFADTRRQSEATRLNEQAAVLRQEGAFEQALEVGQQALEIFRTLADPSGEALTLNGIGLTQARMGDEAGALDSYETAVALLTELGDSHRAGRVLANMGALESGQGHDEQARAYLHDALERLEPGSVEHDRTAQQLRRAG
jgi:tetratricopeptide (TPR) repeat protein